jgi:hypothetical protein
VKQVEFNRTPLIRLQQWSWYVLFVWFGGAVALSFLAHPLAATAVRIGLLVALILTFIRLFLVAEQFRKLQLQSKLLLTWLLVLLLLATVFTRNIGQ